MKVDFKNCDFSDYPASKYIDFGGNSYKVVTIEVVLKDGSIQAVDIAEKSLGDVLCDEDYEAVSPEAESIDETIWYYAEDDESLYSILESAFGEMIVNK